jgi:multicomponent Na+:H+ antiporter subunit D
MSSVHPGLIFFVGALVLPLLKQRSLKQAVLLLIPAAAFLSLLNVPVGEHWVYNFLGYDFIFGRIDKLSLCFGYVFVLVTFLGMVYALHVEDTGQHVAALFHAGAALGVTFAGDLISLFLFWEVMALASAFLIWCQRSDAALKAGFRYLMVHLFGGALLLAGIIMYVGETGTTLFTRMEFGGLGSYLMLFGFLINAAVPPFHPWLPDAYPEATVTGAVFLTAFTTKSAVYVLLRAFPGVELLVYMGAIMTVYGVVYAIIENDIRRLLAYHIVSQVGYMVCGVGLGTELAMNGSTAHAFSHILYKALLFMGAGAVLEVTGKRKMTDLHGHALYKHMPLCLTFYLIGGFAISGAPLLNGFISKPMIVFATGEIHRPVIHLLLHLASIGTFLSTTLKLPYGTWFGKSAQESTQVKINAGEPPRNMLVAMGMTAFACLLTGVYPRLLYDILPYTVRYQPYTTYTVLSALQLLMFTALAFYLFLGRLSARPTISLDTDWFYRKGTLLFLDACLGVTTVRSRVQESVSRLVNWTTGAARNPIEAAEHIMLRKTNRLTPYNADRHRHAIGLGVMYLLILFSLLSIVFLAYR